MQKYTPDFAQNYLTPQIKDIPIGKYQYRAEITANTGWVYECGSKGTRKYRIEYVLGGKNVYYFLTPLEKGRLQTLPVAYDVRGREWFDTTASGIRHFPGVRPGEPINWKESPYTFNTACYSCHVSQLSINHDVKTDTYQRPGESWVSIARHATALPKGMYSYVKQRRKVKFQKTSRLS